MKVSQVFSYEIWMLILAAAAALTLPFTVISTVVDLLAYRRGLPPSSGGAAVAPPILNRRTWLMALLASASLFGIIFAGHALLQGAPGPQGERGAEGPAGPPAQIDPRISELVPVLAKLRWLDEEITKFDDLAKAYEDNSVRYLEQTKQPPPWPKGPMASTLVEDAANKIKQMAASDLSLTTVDFTKAPRYVNNHHCCASAEDERALPDDRSRENLNHVIDQLSEGKQTIREIRGKFDSKRNEYRSVVERAARELK